MDHLELHLEALIFSSTEPLSEEELRNAMAQITDAQPGEAELRRALEALQAKYEQDHYAFHIRQLAGGYQFLTKPAYEPAIRSLLAQKSKKRLSNAALETLAIIAYKQPVTKAAVEQIRGVNCDYTIQKLLEKELVSVKGKSQGPGRPVLYGTSEKFMEYFGINSLNELPVPKDFKTEEENEIGQPESGES